MKLSAKASSGFTRDNETYCCQGCADGTGCTCPVPAPISRRTRRRTGAVEQREPRAGMGGGMSDPPTFSDLVKGRSRTGISKVPTRKAGARKVPKRKRSVTKQRDSTRQQARGRSEFTGAMNRGGATRLSKTGTKTQRQE
ncbi:MAG: hypothetical protein AB9869_04315 [Verrucomicrobiia bacterium]